MICGYLLVLVTVGLSGSIGHKRNSAVDFFLASRTCGAFLLVMTIFGTTMTSFALVGSTGEAYRRGIGVYRADGLLVGPDPFGLLLPHRHEALVPRQALRLQHADPVLHRSFPKPGDRLHSLSDPGGLGRALRGDQCVGLREHHSNGHGGRLSEIFKTDKPETSGGIPPWLGSAMVCVTVLTYVFGGGMRSLSFANAVHASVLILLGGVILFLVVGKLGGADAASALVAKDHPDLLVRGAGEHGIGHMEFLTYMFVPLSVGMFPHLFQHWMTAKDVKTFRPVVILHPIFIMLVWAPCVLLGIWASIATLKGMPVIPANLDEPNKVLGILVKKLTNPTVAGFLGVGIVSATMSLDSQFLALSSMFTHDILLRAFGEKRLGDKQRILLGRSLVVAIVVVAYLVSLFAPRSVYTLGVWCFTGFSGLFPLVFASLYWKRVTAAGAIASIVAALAAWGCLFRESGWGANKDYLFLGMLPAATIVFAATATMIVVSLVTKPPAKEVVERFFPKEEEKKTVEAAV